MMVPEMIWGRMEALGGIGIRSNMFRYNKIIYILITLILITLKSCSLGGSNEKTLGILSPEPDDKFELGSEMSIQWDTDSFQSDDLQIELYEDASVILVISSSTPNSGNYIWSIPENAPWGSDFKLKISENSSDGITVFSEGGFILYKNVFFPDYALETQIKDALNHSSGQINTYNLSFLKLFEGEWITDLTGIEYCGDLQVLRLKYSSFTDIYPLSHLKNLINLRMSKVGIENATPLAELTKLTFLSLHNCEITEALFLSNMNDLIGLELSFNSITDMRPISNLRQLQYLNVQFNQFRDLDWISELINLQKLDLSVNHLNTISHIETLTAIQDLDMSFNEIQNIEALTQLRNIRILNLHGNLIRDVQPLADNPGIGLGDTLYLGGNYFDRSSSAITELQSRGVIVFY
jgi:Leucine-rich repeat (LRR) protein